MKSLLNVASVITVVLCWLLFGHNTAAWGTEVGTVVFVDLDGDGFNDNATDENNDGIPDGLGSGEALKAAGTASSATGIFADKLEETENLAYLLSNSENFGRLSLGARNLCQNRGGCETGFGPGEGIGVGAVKGVNACPGGICPL